ncbi:MAG TPA: hypothetical protein VK687_12545 [Bryobacteraceae bacterium]|nr:hypothetical protein [Bryobacteraceae bacterium]
MDNVGNPVTGAHIVAYCNESRPDGTYRRVRGLFALNSGPNGIVSGTYKQPKAGCEKSVRLHVDKEGYGSSHYDEFRPLYVVRRKVHADDLHRIVQLSGADFNVEMRNMLTSDVDGPFQELVFYYEDRLRQALRSLAEDPEAGIPARSLLAFIGVPEDLRLVARLGSPKGPNFAFAYVWLYGVTCSLLEPSSEAEWSLLRRSALGEYNEYGVTRGAIQSLMLIASPRSREILEEVQSHNSLRTDNSFGTKMIARLTADAIEYIQSDPPPLRDQGLEELGHRVARALRIETWTGNGTPQYNQSGDKALIFINFDVGSDDWTYTAAFQRVDETWVLRGVRETSAGLKGSALATLLRRKTK